MIKLIICLIIITIFYCIFNYKETFIAEVNSNKNCCVIRKKRLGPNFIYTYKKSKFCDDYNDNYLRVVKEGDIIDNKEFNMQDCVLPKDLNNPIFGSCRRLGGFECIDFITDKDCKKYFPALIWDPASCNNKTKLELNHYKDAFDKLFKYEVKLKV
jgi:hypothetical protein